VSGDGFAAFTTSGRLRVRQAGDLLWVATSPRMPELLNAAPEPAERG